MKSKAKLKKLAPARILHRSWLSYFRALAKSKVYQGTEIGPDEAKHILAEIESSWKIREQQLKDEYDGLL